MAAAARRFEVDSLRSLGLEGGWAGGLSTRVMLWVLDDEREEVEGVDMMDMEGIEFNW